MNGRFAVGSRVRVRDPDVCGHVRTPRYVRRKSGTIERVCGRFRKPEDLAYGRRDADAVPLYRVRFEAREVWGDDAGSPLDTIDVEIYEHWLEPENAP